MPDHVTIVVVVLGCVWRLLNPHTLTEYNSSTPNSVFKVLVSQAGVEGGSSGLHFAWFNSTSSFLANVAQQLNRII